MDTPRPFHASAWGGSRRLLLPRWRSPKAFAFGAPADLDPGFGQNGRLTLDSDLARAVAVLPDGRILVAGRLRQAHARKPREGAVHSLHQARGRLHPPWRRRCQPLPLTGRLDARRLATGRYRLIATPIADGRRGDAKRAHFRIKS